METLPSSFLIFLDLKACASDFSSFIVIIVKCSLECCMHFCHDVNSQRNTLCPIHLYAHSALDIGQIQYIFMEPVNGLQLLEAMHTLVIENISSQLRQTVYKSDNCSGEGKWLHLIFTSIDWMDGWMDRWRFLPVDKWQEVNLFHKVSGFWHGSSILFYKN